jgi:outer membrane protein TolC
VQVSNAEYQLQQQEDVLRRLIAADLDPEVRKAPLELIDSPLYPGKTTALETTPAEELVTQALAKRPEVSILQRRHTLDDIGIRQALNALRPDLRLGGNYSSSGLGGNSLVSGVRLHGGLADALRQVADFNNPTYGLTLTLNLPIKSRQAQADLADAEITRRRNLYEQRNTEQNISLEVRNALNRLLQSKANIEGSAAARDLAKKNLEAEQRKYELGATTIFFVLEAQQRASDAETQYLAASVAYKKAVIALQRATGSLLDDNNVVLEQALAGK